MTFQDEINRGVWEGTTVAFYRKGILILDAQKILDSNNFEYDDAKSQGIVKALIEIGLLKEQRKWLFFTEIVKV